MVIINTIRLGLSHAFTVLLYGRNRMQKPCDVSVDFCFAVHGLNGPLRNKSNICFLLYNDYFVLLDGGNDCYVIVMVERIF
jgi:hypothetical protein